MTRDELNAKYCMDFGPGRYGQSISKRKSNLKQFSITPYWPNGTKVTVIANGRKNTFVSSGAPEIAYSLYVKAKDKEDAIQKWQAKFGKQSNVKYDVKEGK